MGNTIKERIGSTLSEVITPLRTPQFSGARERREVAVQNRSSMGSEVQMER